MIENTEGIPKTRAVLKSTFPCLAFPIAPKALTTPTTKRESVVAEIASILKRYTNTGTPNMLPPPPIIPKIKPIRGGTDGARLSFMGLPCPNIFAGGHNFHGKFEYIPAESMEKATEVIINLVSLYSKEIKK
mgnify:CR=1 FL=1